MTCPESPRLTGQYVQYLRLSTRLKSTLGMEILLDKAEAAKQHPVTIYKDYIKLIVKLIGRDICHNSCQLGTKLLTLLICHELHRETAHSLIVKRQELLGHRPVVTTSPSLVQTQ
jgi:hypothetical protein